MKEQVSVSKTFKIVSVTLIAIGIVTLIAGFIISPGRSWANYLVVNYYFLSLAIGGVFFLVIQNISQSGWSSAFRRIPEAMMMYVAVAAVFFLLIYFGMHDLYHWSHTDQVELDPLLQHKAAFLNVPFFFVRMIIYFVSWIVFIRILRRISLKEDQADPSNSDAIMALFGKSEQFSKILIFILAVTFSFSAFDWIMSIDVHWYSTIFALKNLAAAFLHGVSIIALIVIILNKRGYFPFLNKFHIHDFSRYIFMLAIIWGYFWFSQFMIIWYGNIPEETSYYWIRWQGGWKVMFFLEIILNWAIPFLILLPVKSSRSIIAIVTVISFLIIGQYIDIYVQVIPGTTGILKFGWIEAGSFLGFAGLFALIVATALSKAKLMPSNHPYLEESINHHF